MLTLMRCIPVAAATPSLFRRLITTDTRSRISAAISASPVCVFMKGTPAAPRCGFSRAVMQILDAQGVLPSHMHTVDVLEDDAIRSGVKEFSEWPTVPQVFVKGEFIGGCDIMLSMHRSGELEELLVKEGIVEPETEEDREGSSVGASSSGPADASKTE